MSHEINWIAMVIAGCGLVASFYLLIPWLIFASQRMTGDPEIVLFDPQERRPPKRIARYLTETGETLLGLGFEPQPCVALPDPMPNVKAVAQLWIHPQRKDAALVSAIFGDIVKSCVLRFVDQAAGLRIPSGKERPSSKGMSHSWPFNRRQRFWAD